MGKLEVVVGGQFGSESKGRVAAWLTQQQRAQGYSTLAIRVAGPNAGHVVINPKTGTRHALRQIPVGAVVDPNCQLLIAAGSEIDLEVLIPEIEALEADGIEVRNRLNIHGQATMLTAMHRNQEGVHNLTKRTGSTGKGIGAARADRIFREATIAADNQTLKRGKWGILVDDRYVNRRQARLARPIDGQNSPFGAVIEGTQGYGLGLHAGHYPKCTSSDCRAIDFLGMAGLSPWNVDQLRIHVVLRVYPIRVAGNSGELLGETTWADLGLDSEYTTVTKKERRVGGWDAALAKQAVLSNGGGGGSFGDTQTVTVALAMLDQAFPSVAGAATWSQLKKQAEAGNELIPLLQFLIDVEGDTGARITSVGTGPQTTVDVYPNTTKGN